MASPLLKSYSWYDKKAPLKYKESLKYKVINREGPSTHLPSFICKVDNPLKVNLIK